MNDAKKQMVEALKKAVVPDLRQRGFAGSFPHFRRVRENQIDLVTFQFDRYGGGFVIELGQCLIDNAVDLEGQPIPLNKLRAWDLKAQQRARIQASDGPGADSWFRFDGATNVAAFKHVAESILPWIERAEKNFEVFEDVRKLGY